MINLLPQREKYKLRKEKETKEFLILGFVFASLLVSLALILSSILFNLSGKLAFEKEILEKAQQEFTTSQEKNLEQEIVFYKQAAEKIVSYEPEERSVIRILQEISRAKPRGITIDNLSYQVESAKVTLSGHSPDRDLLLEFKARLEQRFDSVSFPASSWVKREDIEFSTSFIVSGNE